MEQDWSNDINQYIEENFTNSYNISIRVTARDLLMVIPQILIKTETNLNFLGYL